MPMRRLGSAFTHSLLALTASVLVVGEVLGGADLSIVRDHISEFAARRDLSGTLVCLSMWGFGLTYLATAALVLRSRSESGWIRCGCLCLTATASLLPFVAVYRLWVPPPYEPTFLDKLFGKLPPRIPPDSNVRQEVHGNAILASMLWVIAGMILI